MVSELLFAALGLVILVLAGDALVRGAVNLALRLGIPSLIVGLTIVAFGTSAPELLVSVKAVTEGASGIALGNVVGSNIANVLLVLGVPALFATIHTGTCDTRRSYIVMLLATALFIALCFAGPLLWWHALILLGALGLSLWDNYRSAAAHRGASGTDDPVESVDPSMPGWRIGLFLALGLVGLPLGADLLVDSAVSIASALGVSDAVIGLTLVAVGTSLPELATSVMAAVRREAEVAVGNVVGSNIFNLLGIIGVAGLVGPLDVPEPMLRSDLWVMAAAALVLVPFVLWRRDITRVWGILLTTAYAAYVLSLVV